MHSCGNPWHDFPQWLAMAVPFLAPAVVWFRIKFGRRSPS